MQNRDVNQIYQDLIARLRAVRRTWRWLILSESLLMWIRTLALVTLLTLLCFQLPVHRFIHIAIVLLFIGGGIYITFRYLIHPLTRKLTDTTVAAYLEKTYPGAENRILSAVQLKPTLADNRFGYAQEFIEELILQTQRDIETIQVRQVFQREFVKIKRNAGIAVLAVGLLLLINFLLPSALNSFTQAFQTLPKIPQDGFTAHIEAVHPGNVKIKQGTDVNITAKVSGHLGAPVSLYYRVAQPDNVPQQPAPTTEEEIWQSLPMQREPTDISYQATIENVDRSLHYYVKTKDVASAHYQIAVSHEPLLKTFQLQLSYPAYTQLPTQTLEADTGDIQVLLGTEVAFTGESNKPLTEAHLIFDSGTPVPLTIRDTTHMVGSFIAEQAGTYHIQLLDTDGLTNPDPPNYTLNVFKDTAPVVEIIEPGKDLVLDNAMRVKLSVEATDDYGIHGVQLVYRIQKEDVEPVPIPLKRITTGTADSPAPLQTLISLKYTWDVDPIGLFPGEAVSYYVQAVDVDNVSGPNIGKSRTYTLRLPTLDELYEAIAAEQEAEQRGFDEIFDEQADATGIVDELLDKIRKSKELTLTDEKLMQQVVDAQKEIEQKANELIAEMEQTATEMQKNQLFEPETVQKYQELQELMEKALSEEHKEILKKLAEALAQQELTEQENAMTEANFNQEQFLQQLERMKSLYEQLLLQQELEASAKQAKELAEQQKQLMDELDTTPASENVTDHATSEKAELADAAQKETRIQQESDKLSEKLDTLGNKMSELAESQETAAPQTQKIADEVKRLNQFARDEKLSETLQDTSENLRNAQKQDALQTGRKAEDTLSALAQGLDNALEFMEGANADQALTAMREAVKSGLHLSHLHENVINQTNDLLGATTFNNYIPNEIKQLQQLAATELSAAKGVAQLAEKLWELGKQQMQIEPRIVWRLNASSEALTRAARALEDREPGLALPIQKNGLADINQAVDDLLTAMAQMNQQMAGSGLQNMMEQLQQLAQNQEQLNQMAQTLSQQMREQGQTPGIQQRLERLASQQQRIREAMERLAEMAEQAAEVLGSLKDIAEEMEDVEKKLAQRTLDDQVLDKQQHILTRMLDSLKSLQKRDVGRQRKAEAAKNPAVPLQEVPPLHPELLEIVRKLEVTPNAKEIESIPFQYREQLRQYFKALSQKTR